MSDFINFNTIIFILLLIAIVAIFAGIFILKTPKKKKNANLDYTAALNYLLSGERQKALEKLKETVQKDTAYIDAYIKIGDILREKGLVERAIKIHRGLTVRNSLSTLEHIEILKSLIKDYRAAKKYDKAIAICQDLLALTRNELWVLELQLKLFEEKGDWDKAYEARKKINRKVGETDNSILALYKVEAGLKLTEDGRQRDGRIKYREAIKIDKTCAPAYLYLSDSYIKENRLSDALTELERFIKRVPNLSYLAFDRIKEILFQKGNFGEIESIYNSLLQGNPNIPAIRFALADIYERKGNLEKAIALCKDELEKNPESNLAKQYLIKYYARTNEKEKALQLALELTDNYLCEEKKFSCSNCGFTAAQPYWHCPQCHEWNSFLN